MIQYVFFGACTWFMSTKTTYCAVSFELVSFGLHTSLSWFADVAQKTVAPLQFISRAVCDLFIQDMKKGSEYFPMRSCAVASLLTNALKNVREIQPLDVSFEPVLYLSVVQSYGKVLIDLALVFISTVF